jgi:Ca-activated chloride channel family protein
MGTFHFLRPWWLLCALPLAALALSVWHQVPHVQAWSKICDSHLLKHVLHLKGQGRRKGSFLCLILSALFMVLANSGPTWHQFPVPTYKPLSPRVLLLDVSDSMFETDLSPSRFNRAKFKLHDLLAHKEAGQFALIAYTGEPFVVSPLTDDGQTISVLLSSLTAEVMPVGGHNLKEALLEAEHLIQGAGFSHGQLLVLTANTPSALAIKEAARLAGTGIYSSIMPVIAKKDPNPLYQSFAQAGKGELLVYQPDSSDLELWLKHASQEEKVALNKQDDIPLWRDEGRWFLIPALVFLLPVFRKAWLQRIAA